MAEIGISSSDSRNYSWQSSHIAIEQCILAMLEKDKRLPTWKEIEMATGLSQRTIARHSKDLDFKLIREKSRLLGPAILEAQARRAYITGDHNEAKTYFKLNYDWKESSDVSVSVSHSFIGRSFKEICTTATDAQFEEIESGIASGKYLVQGDTLTEATSNDVSHGIQNETETGDSEA